MTGAVQKALIAAALLLVLVVLVFGLRGYQSSYYLVAATRGDKPITEYERLLRRSLASDSDNGRANSTLASFLLAYRKIPEALEYHQRSMQAYRPVEAFEQLGTLQERHAQTSGDQSHLLEAAAENFEKTLRMNPGNVSALERLMAQAYRRRDKAKLEELAEELARLDWGNRNGIYLRALLEEATGNYASALPLLQSISSSGEPHEGALYTLDDVRERLRRVQAQVRSGT